MLAGRRVLAIVNGSAWSVGWLAQWLLDAGITLELVHPYAGDRVPAALRHDGLLVLPSSVGVYADEQGPWLAPLRSLVRDAVRLDRPVLGICFGAQLLAAAHGGRVGRVAAEFGIHPVRRNAAGAADRLFGAVPEEANVVLWHDEAVLELPPGAVALAENDVCLQGFRLGDRAWGVQFHPEATTAGVRDWALLYAEALWAQGRSSAEVVDEVRAERTHLTWRPFIARFAREVNETAAP